MPEKRLFVVSTDAIPEHSKKLFLADPYLQHALTANDFDLTEYDVEVAPFLRKSANDLLHDYTYVNSKYLLYLPILAKALNNLHNLDLPIEFWKRAMSMGIHRHLTFLYDFFRICESYLKVKNHSTLVPDSNSFYLPINYDDQRWFLQHSGHGQAQMFNHYLSCFQIEPNQYYAHSYKSSYKISEITSHHDTNPAVGIMGTLIIEEYMNQLLGRSKGDIARIGFRRAYKIDPVNVNLAGREALSSCTVLNADRFDRFFFYTLRYLMPREFVEDFSIVTTNISTQLNRYKRLKYVVSEYFIGESYESIALALLYLRGIKSVYHEHNYNEHQYAATMHSNFSSLIDIFAVHGSYHKTIANGIPAGSLYNFAHEISKEKKNHILFISWIAFAKHCIFAHQYSNSCEHADSYYRFKTSFFDHLPEMVLASILYRGYPIDNWSSNWKLSYDDKLLMQKYLAYMKIDDNAASSKERMAKSRLVIIDYASTAHLEAMSMNVPTVFFVRPESFILNEQFKDFFTELIKVGICQTDPVQAAIFIKTIWQEPERWWASHDVQKAKDDFLAKNLGQPERMIEYLLTIAKEGNNQMHSYQQHKNSLDQFYLNNTGVYISNKTVSEFSYSDGKSREVEVLNILSSSSNNSTDSEYLKNSIKDWVTEYHFSPQRHNLLRHLKLNSNMDILELGCGCGAITRQLGESGANVTAIEGSLIRAQSAAVRCRDLPNVKVYCSNFQDINFTTKNDVVTLIGVMEYSRMYFRSDDPIQECLNIAKNALKPDGVLLVAIENQLGLKYFCGYREDHVDIPYFGIEDRYTDKAAVTFGRKELERILNNVGFSSVEFHYPFPDYKVPKAVFTSRAFNDESFRPDAIIQQLGSRDYAGELIPSFDEKLAVPVLCRNGLMEDLSHSFLVLASREHTSIKTLSDPKLLATYYSLERANAFNVQTRFIRTGQQVQVHKSRTLPGKFLCSPNDILTHTPRTETYIAGSNLETEYRKCVMQRDFEKLSALFAMQIKFMLQEAILLDDTENPAASTIKPEFFDCIPSNLILTPDGLSYIDREWSLNKNVSFGALLLRTVDALYQIDTELPELKKENLISILERFGFKITTVIIDEYNAMISAVIKQVYEGANLPFASSCNDKNDTRTRLENLKSMLEFLPKSDMELQRLRSHITQTLLVHDGLVPGTSDAKGDSVVSVDDITLCNEILEIISKDPEWTKATDFVRTIHNSLVDRISKKENGAAILQQYKKFNYDDEFKDYICPNPFLYAELRQNGDINCCCYLPFSFGNLHNSNITEVWNSDIANELRRSILSGEFCYCDKTKCATMQQIYHQSKRYIDNYQIPYTLVNRTDLTNDTLCKCLKYSELSSTTGPEIISLEDDPSCNLSCPSCRKQSQVLSQSESNILYKQQQNIINTLGHQLKELWFCGAGDPFAAYSYRNLLQSFDFNRFPQISFRIDTNGMLLNDQTWNTVLKNISDRISLIAVSVDAASAITYSDIRKGGQFEILLNNLKYIADRPERKTGMSFIIRMIVQEKNFREMKQFIKLGHSLGVDGIVFSVMQNWGTFSPQEYQDQAVHLPDHPAHSELCAILQDKIFEDPLVNLGNLVHLHASLQQPLPQQNVSLESETEHFGNLRARVIAFYLPQFHPIPENDKWWGKGFTEWTNVGKAKPLFDGHYQPHVPADLGYYDLRVPETRMAQAELARSYGVEAFCYYHYWFAGRRILERPFDEVIKSGQPDFPFCLCWANSTWSGIWHGAPDRVLIEQTYPGLDDYKEHFYSLLPAFKDPRYLRVNGKLLFIIYAPFELPDSQEFTSYWQHLAQLNDLGGFHFVAHGVREYIKFGCQSCLLNAPFASMQLTQLQVDGIYDKLPRIYDYAEFVNRTIKSDLALNEHPLVFPNWDNTPRSGVNGLVLHGSTPELFKAMLEDAVKKTESNPNYSERLVFVKAWNEWAEGNHLEPDLHYGHRYLEVLRETLLTK